MKTYKVILFDLDGTLTDPQVGITKSIQYALAKFDIEEQELDKLTPFIGPPLVDSFKAYYGFNDEQAWRAREYYREYFAVKGIYENGLYEGIHELLAGLSRQGKKLIVATSKPTLYAEEIVRHFGLVTFIELVVGSNMDGTFTDKQEIIEHIVAELSCRDKKQLVMVGDRKYDIIGARKAGVDSIAVGYGYGTREELAREKPTYLAETVRDLARILGNRE
jgi:phosphoglycolate phosphatase